MKVPTSLMALVAVVGAYTPLRQPSVMHHRRACAVTCGADRDDVAELGETPFEGQIARLAPRSALQQVREQLAKTQKQLGIAIEQEDYVSAALLRDDLNELRAKDPAVMAASLRDDLQQFVQCERYDEAARVRDELLVLRRFLPQYQLAGLWKGNYPNHGDELVRLHYSGDTLFATKVTGDEHVPAGEVTFRADLTAPIDANADRASSSSSAARGMLGAGGDDAVGVRVEVLSLSEDGAREPREVETYAGEGRIAARGFRQPHYVPGQLFLMDEDVVGFFWMPIGTFVVFSRVPEKEEEGFSA